MEDKMREAHERRDEMRAIERGKKQEVFLAALSEWGTVKKSCQLSGVAHDTYKRWHANMPKKYRPQLQMSDESSKELIKEWREAAHEVAKSRSAAPTGVDLPEPVEQTLEEILSKRSGKKIEE